MGMSRATGYYLRSGRGAATTDPETTNKNEPITDLGDRTVLAIDGPLSFGVGTIRLFTLCPPVRLCSSGEWARAKKGRGVEETECGWWGQAFEKKKEFGRLLEKSSAVGCSTVL